jgi:uroporphyrinogen decarboxylase
MSAEMSYEKTTLRTLRKDRLTDRERMEALWARQKPDRVTIMPLTLGFAALNAGYHLNDFYFEPKKCVDALRWANEQYGWHPFLYYMGSLLAYPAEEFGGEVKYPTGEFAQAPSVVRHPVETEDDVYNMKVPDNLDKVGMIPRALEATAYMLKFDGITKMPLALGPLDLAGAVIGTEKVSRWLIRKPEVVHHALKVLNDFQIAVAKLFADTFGAEKLLYEITAPSEANQIISPNHFKEFCVPYMKELLDNVREMGYKYFRHHICGEHNLNLPFWAEIDLGGPGIPAIISVGHEVELEKVAKFFPNDIAFGNLEPALIQTGTPEEVYEHTKNLLLRGKELPVGFIFSSGCEIPPKAPPYNLWMMTKAVNDFGWYE